MSKPNRRIITQWEAGRKRIDPNASDASNDQQLMIPHVEDFYFDKELTCSNE
jgi:hypothetical protein